MAQVVGGQVKLNNGQVVVPQQGAWYDGQQYWGGTLSQPGQINSLSNQQGAGQQVSNEVIAQTNPNNVAYIQQQRQQQGLPTQNAITAEQNAYGGGGAAAGVPNLVDEYNKLTNTPEIQALRDQISKREQERDQAISEAQNNPWYSQATRGGKIAAITTDAQRELTRLQGQLDSKLSDASTQLGLEKDQYSLQHQAQQDALAASAVNTTTYDDGTNTYAVSIDKNGNVVNKQLIGASKQDKSSGGSSKTTSSDIRLAAGQAAASGKTYQDMLAFFVKYGLSPTDVYQIYTSANYYGRAPDGVDPKTGLYTADQ